MTKYQSARNGEFEITYLNSNQPGDVVDVYFRVTADQDQYREVKVSFSGTLLSYWDMDRGASADEDKLSKYGELRVQLALEKKEIKLHSNKEENPPATLSVQAGDQRTSYEDDLQKLEKDLEQARTDSSGIGFR